MTLHNHVKDTANNNGGFFVNNPKIFIVGVFFIPIKRNGSDGLAAHALCSISRFHLF
jgi:hypothetical protein